MKNIPALLTSINLDISKINGQHKSAIKILGFFSYYGLTINIFQWMLFKICPNKSYNVIKKINNNFSRLEKLDVTTAHLPLNL